MDRRQWRGVILGLLAAAMVAATAARAQMEPPPVDSPPLSPSPVEAAVADLAARLGIDPATVTVVSAAEVTWPDSSLGCPDPGRAYLQMLTDGWRIVLSAGGTTYEYHAGSVGAPFFCANPSPPLPAGPPGEQPR